jgi:2-polyprenyl-3-methyl-5-hydroxy-6-metoxy-1,4-benzoquinol methylase
MLAVLEHISAEAQANLVKACADLLRDGGRVIITVPSPSVDYILSLLQKLRLIDGMSLAQHFGFDPQDTKLLFRPPVFNLCCQVRHRLGLNHLFVFEK